MTTTTDVAHRSSDQHPQQSTIGRGLAPGHPDDARSAPAASARRPRAAARTPAARTRRTSGPRSPARGSWPPNSTVACTATNAMNNASSTAERQRPLPSRHRPHRRGRQRVEPRREPHQVAAGRARSAARSRRPARARATSPTSNEGTRWSTTRANAGSAAANRPPNTSQEYDGDGRRRQRPGPRFGPPDAARNRFGSRPPHPADDPGGQQPRQERRGEHRGPGAAADAACTSRPATPPRCTAPPSHCAASSAGTASSASVSRMPEPFTAASDDGRAVPYTTPKTRTPDERDSRCSAPTAATTPRRPRRPRAPATTSRRGAAASGSSGQTRCGQTVQPGSPCRGSSGPSIGGEAARRRRVPPGSIIVTRPPPVGGGGIVTPIRQPVRRP